MSAGRQTPQRKPGRASRPSILRQINAKAQLAAINGNRHLHPKCGAKARSTGEPCRQLAMSNGRCRWHGGKTGRGKQWGLPVWPDRDAPGAMDKVNRKLRDLTKAAKKRERRVAAMTPEERADYEKWKRAHKPGSSADRARARALRKQNAEARAMIDRMQEPRPASEQPPQPEIYQGAFS